MTLTIEVSPEEEAWLVAAAAGRGQDVSNFLLALARQEFQSPLPVPKPSPYEGMSLAEALQGRIGLYASAEPSSAGRHSEEEFGKIMDEKKRQGHL